MCVSVPWGHCVCHLREGVRFQEQQGSHEGGLGSEAGLRPRFLGEPRTPTAHSCVCVITRSPASSHVHISGRGWSRARAGGAREAWLPGADGPTRVSCLSSRGPREAEACGGGSRPCGEGALEAPHVEGSGLPDPRPPRPSSANFPKAPPGPRLGGFPLGWKPTVPTQWDTGTASSHVSCCTRLSPWPREACYPG